MLLGRALLFGSMVRARRYLQESEGGYSVYVIETRVEVRSLTRLVFELFRISSRCFLRSYLGYQEDDVEISGDYEEEV